MTALDHTIEPVSGDGSRLTWAGFLKPRRFLLILYAWWLIATPAERFDWLADLHFERVLAAVLVLALLSGLRLSRQAGPTTVLLVSMFLWQFLCHTASPYPNARHAILWDEEYWKVILLYFFWVHAVHHLDDLLYLLIGVGIVSFTYQAYTWLDFLRGGSYVYQQGMVRMVGVWSGRTLGSANAYGLLGLLSIPFAVFWFETAERRWEKVAAVLFLVVSAASIVFSGTRGALLTAVLLALVMGWKFLRRPRILLLVVAALVVFALVLPPRLAKRFLPFLSENSSPISSERADIKASKIAKLSAESRIQGLLDGIALAARRPILGYGPGASPIARTQLPSWHQDPDSDTGPMGLHSLYGQVLGETGVTGTILFIMLVASCWLQTTRVMREYPRDGPNGAAIHRVALFVRAFLFAMLVYGFVGHTLYRYQWMLVFGTQTALSRVVASMARPTRSVPEVRARKTMLEGQAV